MTSYELDEMGAGSPMRHNTSTLESQPNTLHTPQNSTSRRNSSQPSALDPVPTPAPGDRSYRSMRRNLFQDLFGKKEADWWARSRVEKALLAASKHDKWFPSDYIQIRELTNAHLNKFFDIQLSLPPSDSNQSSCLSEVSNLEAFVFLMFFFLSGRKQESRNFGNILVK